jgi:hypothetical protein
VAGDETVALRAIAAFVVAGGYVTTMARLVEHLGSKLGGLLLALPSTVLVGVTFIAWSEGHDGLRQASAVLPVTVAAATVFLAVFIRFSRFGLAAGYVGAIAAWLAITVPIAATHLDNVAIATALSVLIFGSTIAFFRHVPHRSVKLTGHSWRRSATRFVVAGAVAASTVVVAHYAGSVWGAVCASFPAVFSASLYLMTKAHGIDFTASLGRTMTFGCMANAVFGLSIWIFCHWISSAAAIAVAYATALLFAAIAHRHLIELFGRNESVQPA